MLLAPEYIEKNIDVFQRISGGYEKNHFTANAWVNADKTEIPMKLFNGMGTSLGTLIFTGKNLKFISSYIPRNLRTEYGAEDFQFCFYHAEAILSARTLQGIFL
ncbi:MAG: DUF3261 domain-containing protein [Treponema sp.]|nr:DUF3261 domain-containing protein [Treponema sp.]